MKVAIAQISPLLGDVSKNLRLHLDLVEEAKTKKADQDKRKIPFKIHFPPLSFLEDSALDVR